MGKMRNVGGKEEDKRFGRGDLLAGEGYKWEKGLVVGKRGGHLWDGEELKRWEGGGGCRKWPVISR